MAISCKLDVKVSSGKKSYPYLAHLKNSPHIIALICQDGYVYLDGDIRAGKMYLWSSEFANRENQYEPLAGGTTATLTQA